ncbi:unnamed protein product [Adineta ricciae]|uniref:G domain-containing protein n=1 Tax=Adineta ricciae TaxID=249248 RepID=A0A814RZ79_ADIRI|nr:unnamed protein product [Adineta ricciae]
MTSQQFKCTICTKDIDCSVKPKVIENNICCSDCIKSPNSNNKIPLKPQNTAASSNKPHREESNKTPTWIIKNGRAPPLVTDHPNSVEFVEPDVHSIIAEADNIFHDLRKDMNIVVCGPPRAGKSTLINDICGREVCRTGAGLASITYNYDKLLPRYITDLPREDNGVKFCANIGLTIAINSQRFKTDDGEKSVSGVNELINGVMESLVDEKLVEWLLVVLENKGFLDKHLKLGRIGRFTSRNFRRMKNKSFI